VLHAVDTIHTSIVEGGPGFADTGKGLDRRQTGTTSGEEL